MGTRIYQSSAFITFLVGDHIQDVQILVEDRQLFNALPGKSERKGIKSLATWPFFVTAILDEDYPEDRNPYASFHHQSERAVREGQACQLPIFDFTNPTPIRSKTDRNRVRRTLSEIRKLHEDLNAALYARPTERPQIQSPSDAFQILVPFLGSLDHEELWVVCMDVRHRVVNLTKLYQGSVNTSQVRVGEVFRQAIMDNNPAIVIAHNHPSGDPTPSPDDVSVTRAIVQAGKLLDIDVLDHLVICCRNFVSLKERGLGFGG